jgi:transglutaminase-like putative cysteine protease
MLRSCRGGFWGVPAAVLALVVLGGAAPTTDSWDAVYLAGSKVGHTHTYVEAVKNQGRDLVRVRFDMKLSYKRLGDTVSIGLEYGTIETPDGEVLRLDTLTRASKQVMRSHGDVVDGKMTLILDAAGQRQQQTIDWGPDVRGPYAAEQSLARQMMTVGESRTLKMFMPELNRVCDITMTAKLLEDVKLGGGVNRRLLRVDQTTILDGKARSEFDVTLWVDSSGQVLKTKSDNLGGLVTYRTTKEGAEATDVTAAGFDQILNSVIKVPRKIPRPDTTREVRYRIGLKGEDVAQILPADRRQSPVGESDKSRALLTVKTAGPEVGTPETGAVDPACTRPNSMINSADERVVALARQAVGTASDPWEKSKRIVHWVAKNLRDKNFSTGFATASEVARNLTGDCTEHGVLVAAMCRAEGVPARVVSGLVYADNLGGFGYHMWNEVYVNQRWVAVDAAFDQEAVDAVHLKLSESSMDGVAPFETFLPILRVLGKMTVEPLEIR